MDNQSLYNEEQRQILLDTQKSIDTLVDKTTQLLESYVEPKDEVKVSGKLEVNTEKQIEVTNLETLREYFNEMSEQIQKSIETNSHAPLKEITIKNITDARSKEVKVSNIQELSDYIQPLVQAIVDKDMTVNVQRQDLSLPTNPKNPLPVRLSDGKSFYNAITQAMSGALPFKDVNNKGIQVQLDGVGNVPTAITSQDTPSIDAFARWRTSNPETIFDSKQIFDNQPLFWDDQQVSGTGTTSVHSKLTASTLLGVGTSAGRRVRQTFQRFNYQPGKSQLIFLTGTLKSGGGTGIKRSMGIYDDNNGIFARDNQGTIEVVLRSNTTGTPLENAVPQSQWNKDRLDGTGPSGITLNPDASQIVVIDFEWLGVGRVRIGFVIDGLVYYVHNFLNANNLSGVYMSTPNLPLRYEIENDGTGVASQLEHICSSVISEGGSQATGVLRHQDSGPVGGITTGSTYGVLAIRLNDVQMSVLVENISFLMATAGDLAHWELRLNPTVAGTLTFTAKANSPIDYAIGTSANTVTGGIEIDGGFFSDTLPTSTVVPNALKLGSKIDGTPDILVVCIIPLTNNMTIETSLTWRELS